MNTIPNIEQITADYHLFVDIQMGKYLKAAGKNEFTSDAEAKSVIGIILQTWNDKIADQHKRLDASTPEAKTAWFNSINIDFANKHSSNSRIGDSSETRKQPDDMAKYYDNIFPFLPEGAIMFLLFAGPVLEVYGYSLTRFKKLIDGEQPTEIEKNMLLWAYDIAMAAMSAFMEKSKTKKDKLLTRAIGIAKEELDDDAARISVAAIYEDIKEHFSKTNMDKSKPALKKKKR